MIVADKPLPKSELKIVLSDLDNELYDELRGTTETKTSSGATIYHPPRKDEEHDTDSCRYGCLAMLAVSPHTALDDILKDLGWTGPPNNWTPPW